MSEASNDFEQLQKLLALKRYEQPPPGYFRDLPGRIAARLETVPTQEISWFQRLWAVLETKPMVAGSFGIILCGVLMTSMFYSQRMDEMPVATGFENSSPFATVSPMNESMALNDQTFQGLATPVSTNPVNPATFFEVPTQQAQKASFSLDGN